MIRATTLFLLALSGCAPPSISLVERDGGERVGISGVSREALTPGFPGTRRFEVDVPAAGFLYFAPALVAENVRRARVMFRVHVEANGERSIAYEEVFRFTDANRWHDREIDLNRWAGRRVTLVLETRTPEDRTSILWADRIQAVWGEPRIVSSQSRQLARFTDDVVSDAEGWLIDRVQPGGGVRPEDVSNLAINLFLAGLFGLAIRGLYLRFAFTSSRHDAFDNLFPLFSMATVLVIVVVQSSLALSLGLIGALSIVRFRTAIKTPEEIAYLLFCIAVGVALGAQQRSMALASVVLVSLFVVARYLRLGKNLESRYLLTITGKAGSFFDEEAGSALERVRPMVRELQMQRLDQASDRVELRAVVTVDGDEGMTGLIARLHRKLPALHFSFVEADDAL